MKFIIDTNIFITPANSYYNANIAPSFWEQLNNLAVKGQIVTLDKVIDELINVKEKDWVASWVKNTFRGKIIKFQQQDIINQYQNVINYLGTSGYYQRSAITEWSREKVADGWIIATALARGYTVCTLENFNRGLNKNFPSKTAKVPNVISDMGGDHYTLFEMMEALGISL